MIVTSSPLFVLRKFLLLQHYLSDRLRRIHCKEIFLKNHTKCRPDHKWILRLTLKAVTLLFWHEFLTQSKGWLIFVHLSFVCRDDLRVSNRQFLEVLL